ncbi:hypothetical protein [Companilactobacillus hulinensis]|uniref:hypothetical protein n=1 Tax=Companilactobacillus hulinensis TaxID=2486007 RepID=UPI000F794B88|nr:hypothetical protein [Companilactobacillus hulinensis]
MQEIKKDPLYLFIKDRESVIRNKLPLLYFSGEDDNPASFLSLSPQEKTTLVAWVLNTLVKGKSINTDITSYGIKHLFDKPLNGFYVKNGVMKGAMLIAGFTTDNIKQRNWSFNVAEASYKNVHRTNAHTRYINLFKNRLPNKGKVSLS